jgi:hypothetical protein
VPASLPVPEVVGICISATLRPATFSGPTMSAKGTSLVHITATSLARSMALPPPKPTTRSGLTSFAIATAFSRLGRSGSGLTSPNTLTVPGSASVSTRRALKGSEITSGRLAPIRSAKRAAAVMVPLPNSRMVGRWISMGVKALVIVRSIS